MYTAPKGDANMYIKKHALNKVASRSATPSLLMGKNIRGGGDPGTMRAYYARGSPVPLPHCETDRIMRRTNNILNRTNEARAYDARAGVLAPITGRDRSRKDTPKHKIQR